MASPAKRRKLNDTKSSPATSRNLDFFFAQKSQKPAAHEPDHTQQADEVQGGIPDLTDEQLARKLQEEWNQEEQSTQNGTADGARTGQFASAEQSEDLQIKADSVEETVKSKNHQTSATSNLLSSDFKAKTASLFTRTKNTLSLQSGKSDEDTISSTIPFDEGPLTFDPSKYVPDLQSHWTAEGGNASYALLTKCFVLVNSTQSRIKIVDTLVNLLRVIIEGDPSSLLPTVRTIYHSCIGTRVHSMNEIRRNCSFFALPTIGIYAISRVAYLSSSDPFSRYGLQPTRYLLHTYPWSLD